MAQHKETTAAQLTGYNHLRWSLLRKYKLKEYGMEESSFTNRLNGLKKDFISNGEVSATTMQEKWQDLKLQYKRSEKA